MAGGKRTSTNRKAGDKPSDSQPRNAKQRAPASSCVHRSTRQAVHRECISCAEVLAVSKEKFPTLGGCIHVPETCAECLGGWIAAQVTQNQWEKIQCPQTGCDNVLEHKDVQKYASKEVYDRFDELVTRNIMNADPDFSWCRGGCGAGQIHTTGEAGNSFRCAQCGFRMCVIHEDTWHEGETCEQYDARLNEARVNREQEKASETVIQNTTKKCPNKACGVDIKKNNGCDHMTCTKCRHEFCWLCLVDYNKIRRGDNSVHDPSCSHYAAL
ncbi:hypothetical protein P154DRAFT_596343 [Amniculicola lignicola CBS 123094]|uniref:RBR-type E3 ubiquitin transferase n=1 Tax=Amniculicola lignicola CBS 123094 TaxID=1392246 RepID=A0A6A5VTL2_9PLEO|nr:hypothetical protein P154DRAFT_596343 [Amniculicola lignicola CBS 123094]